MKKLLLCTILVFAFTLSGCKSNGGGGGIRGAEPYRTWAIESVDPAIVQFRDQYGLNLVWKWDQWSVNIRAVPRNTDLRDGNGKPVAAVASGGALITIKEGMPRGLLYHEMGHILLNRNGIKGDPEYHHNTYPRFFDAYR